MAGSAICIRADRLPLRARPAKAYGHALTGRRRGASQAFGLRACPPAPGSSSVPAVERLQFADQRRPHLGTVAVEHAGVVDVEQRVLDAGETGALAALDDAGGLRIAHVEDRHAVDRAGRAGLRTRVDPFGGAAPQTHNGV